MRKIKKFFEDYCYGDRKRKEYIVAAVVSIVISLITLFVIPIILYFNTAKAENILRVWIGFLIITIGIAAPIISHAFLMLRAKKLNKSNKEKAESKLSSEWQTFRYKANDQNRLIKDIIYRTPFKFEAKMKNDVIYVRVIAPDGGLIHMEETRDYFWFNTHFSMYY